MLLTGGDITRRDEILWGFTMRECLPYIKVRYREVQFREAILNMLGVKPPDSDGGTVCDEKQKARCRFEFGDYMEWACKECESAGQKADKTEESPGENHKENAV